MKRYIIFVFAILYVDAFAFANGQSTEMDTPNALVFQSDFGLKDGAVSTMKGVAVSVAPNIPIFDITHEIPAYNIWEGSYRLLQVIQYWPEGTVFVSVVDPGVGTDRKSVVVKTADNKYIVTPDNGTLTLIADELGIQEVREIDESVNRLAGSSESYTFHGRDVYSYTGARLAAGVISFAQVGKSLGKSVVRIDYEKARISGNMLVGTIPVLDVQYGNVWTNINSNLIQEFTMQKGQAYRVRIYQNEKIVYDESVPYVDSFGDVPEGAPLLYLNSLLNLSIALNIDTFAGTYNIASGPEWKFIIGNK